MENQPHFFTFLAYTVLLFQIFRIYRKTYKYELQLNKRISLGNKYWGQIASILILFVPIFYVYIEFTQIYDLGTSIFHPIGITTGFWIIAHYSTVDRPKSKYFNRLDSEFKTVEFKDASHTNIYPRITIMNSDFKFDDDNGYVFDSSDFQVINSTLGVFNGEQPSFKIRSMIKINNKSYMIENVRVDLLKIYDDYSFLGHTPVYQGINTPYNIQIIVDVSEKK